MNRLLVRFLTCVTGLFIFLALAALWVRSYWRTDIVACYTPSGHPQWIASDRGQVLLFTSTVTPGRMSHATVFREDTTASAFKHVRKSLIPDPTLTHSAFGFEYTLGVGTGLGFDRGSYVFIAVPHWFLIGLTLLLAIPLIRRRVQASRRSRAGLCPKCGYDLRATPGFCPECGSQIHIAQTASGCAEMITPLDRKIDP